MKIRKRNDKIVDFDTNKIITVLDKTFVDYPELTEDEISNLKETIINNITAEAEKQQDKDNLFDIEDCQDIIVASLKKLGYRKIANSFQRYREGRAVDRQLRKVFEVVSNEDTDEKTENANVDGYTMSGRHLHISEDVLKIHSSKHVYSKKVMKAIDDGIIYAHDRGWTSIGSLTCLQIHLPDLFKDGFNTGHGYLREPGGIKTAFMLSAIAIQSSQNDFHGGQSIPQFDFGLAPYVMKSYRKYLCKHLEAANIYMNLNLSSLNEIKALIKNPGYLTEFEYLKTIQVLERDYPSLLGVWDKVIKLAIKDTEDEAYQGAEGLIHNLNTMHSRAGAQVPFSSINFGLDTSEAGRLVAKSLLQAQMDGLGHHETPIFPILIYTLKKGVNFNKDDKNYDIFRLAMQCSSERLFPTYSFVDSSFNLPFYEKDHYYGAIQTMGAVDGKQRLQVKFRGTEISLTFEELFNLVKNNSIIDIYHKNAQTSSNINCISQSLFTLLTDELCVATSKGYKPIRNIWCNFGQKDLLELTFSDNSIIACTKDHPLATQGLNLVMVEAKDLKVGDVISCVGSNVSITEIKELDFAGAVYDLEVDDECHNFILNDNIISSNCRTRVMANVNGREGAIGRGNLSFTSINLPMLALNANGNVNKFYKELDKALELADLSLTERYKIQAQQQKRNLPFMAGCNMWLDSDKLTSDYDSIEPLLKHGTLSIGFVGLAECLICLLGKHHGESEEADKLGYEIISYIKDYCDKRTKETHLNFTCLGTPAETYCHTALKQCRSKYGIIPNVTERDYLTNSSHIPVYYPISISEKARIEGKYHKLENAGHIFYCEVDGDISKNIDAFEQILHTMSDADIGYGAVNIPIIYCPNCYKSFRGSDDVHVCPYCSYCELEETNIDCDCK